MARKKNAGNAKNKQLRKAYKLSKLNFTGSYLVLFGLFFVGIFLPPVMSMMVIYLFQRVVPKKPKLFDRNLLAFSITLFVLWAFSMSLSGISFLDAVSKSLFGSLLVIIVVYPFVFAWLHFDWSYRRLRA